MKNRFCNNFHFPNEQRNKKSFNLKWKFKICKLIVSADTKYGYLFEIKYIQFILRNVSKLYEVIEKLKGENKKFYNLYHKKIEYLLFIVEI